MELVALGAGLGFSSLTSLQNHSGRTTLTTQLDQLAVIDNLYFRKRLDCNERIVRHGLMVIDSSGADDHDASSNGGAAATAAAQQVGATPNQPNQGSLLIDATCVPAGIRHPTDLSLLNVDEVFSEGVARELTETLIDAMHLQVRDSFGHKPRKHRKQARQSFLAVAKKKRPREPNRAHCTITGLACEDHSAATQLMQVCGL